MCLIAVKVPGAKLPKDEHLINGEQHNSDGIGIAYWKKDSTDVNIKKDFKNINDFLDFLHKNIKEEDACLIHFRYATHGLKDEGNRHPFPITKNKELLRKTELICQSAVVHNGVISEYNKHTKYSDTQKFVLDILSDDSIKNNLESPAVRKLVLNFLGGDRLAILINTGVIYLFGDYEKEDDIFYSNKGYTYQTRKNFEVTRNNWNGYYDYSDDGENYKTEITPKEKFLLKGFDKWEGYMDICEGCLEKKHVRYTEIEGHNVAFRLCKGCRKRIRKGKLKMPNKTELFDEMCQCCNEWLPREELKLYQNYLLCLTCYADITKELGIENKTKQLEDKSNNSQQVNDNICLD